MARKGYINMMLQHGIEVLNGAAEDVAAFERFPVIIRLPGAPGVAPTEYEVDAYFDENPAVQPLTSIGIKNALNGILYIRETQTPVDLTRLVDQTIPVGMEFIVRGRRYRCTRADFARGEYAFLLSDMNEAGA